jgi:monofunctional glycosyltransferase
MAKRSAPAIPRYRRRRKRNPIAVVLGWIFKIVLAFLILSALWVLAYRFINPPITATMVKDIVDGRGAAREWMPIDRIDRDMVRAVIAAEDSKFCQHNGFDVQAIEQAAQRNASGGRIRGGSTISQQTAKNAFLWQGGGYFRKGLEAWFTLLMEQMWPKHRIMEVYLNIAETGIGTYGVNAGAKRYFGRDASALTPTEAARIAAVLPLPKARGAIAPTGFTRRYGNTISARMGNVRRDGLDACVYQGIAAPRDRTPQQAPSQERPAPGAEYETADPPPPRSDEAPPAPELSPATPPAPGPPPPGPVETAPPAGEPPSPPQNGV